MTTAAQPIQTRVVQPAQDRDISSQRPTETRYGWCAFGDINLVGPDGTPNLYVQPHKIDNGAENIDNEYHRVLPKGQLIPFPTFAAIESVVDPDRHDANGRALLIQGTRTITALEAATMVLRQYSGWGFVILNSLQGLPQDVAMRIFQVVHPFAYPMGDLLNELQFGAHERIESNIVLTFPEFPGYEVQPLLDEEREIARALASEMEAGADIAIRLATETLDDTEASMTQKFSGGSGKSGPDALDRRLSADLGRELPKMVGGTQKQADLENKIDFLVDRETSRADKEEIARLKQQLAEMQGINGDTMKAQTSTCGFIKANGEPCKSVTKEGELCKAHAEATVEN